MISKVQVGHVFPLRFGQESKTEPPKAQKIQWDPVAKKHIVPDHVEIPVIEGDGIGPEIVKASKKVVEKALSLSYGDKRSISWLPMEFGTKANAAGKGLIPEDGVQTIKDHKIFVKAPLDTPLGGGFRSVNVQLRRMFDMFACIRPLKSLQGMVTPLKNSNINLVLFRENTDDIYQGVEFEKDSEGAKELIKLLNEKYDSKIRPDSGIGIKPISEFASKRFVERAIQYAIDNDRPIVTLVGKANIMKYTEGAFLKWGFEVAKEKFGDKVVTENDFWSKYNGQLNKLPKGSVVLKQRLTDAMMMELIKSPEKHSVIATMNLNGDLMSDEGAALIGGLGVAPGANIGEEYAMFESTHGSAPDIAGQNKANPTALLRTIEMMLDFMGWKEAAKKIETGIEGALVKGKMTGDVAVEVNKEGGLKKLFGLKREKVSPLSTDAFADAVVEAMENESKPKAGTLDKLKLSLNKLKLAVGLKK